MRGTNRKRALLVSGAVVLLCMTVVVGMTWALFTDTQKVTNHLKAGDLNITLERVGLKKTMLNSNGYLETVEYSEEDAKEDFSDPEEENVFDIKDDEKIVPLSEYTADMKITNKSDVAFKYYIQIATSEENESDPELAEQIEVTVTVKGDNGETITKRLDVGLSVGDETDANAIDVLGVGDYGEFTVNVKFLDDRVITGIDNDDAQGDNVYFDLVVHAVQYTGAEPD